MTEHGGETIDVLAVLPFADRLPSGQLETLLLKSGLGRSGNNGTRIRALDLDDRITVRAFADVLARALVERVADQQLQHLVPSLRLLDGEPILADDAPVRLFNLLRRHRTTDWKLARQLRPLDVLGWFGAGRITMRHLAALAIERGLILHRRATSQALPIGPVGAPHQQGDAAPSGAPLLANSGDHAGLDSAITRVFSELEARQKRIFIERCLAMRDAPTLKDFAAEMKITRERVRQLEASALHRVTATLKRPENSVLAVAGEDLAHRLGSAAPLTSIPAHVLRPSGMDTLHTLRESLLLRIAGPYEIWNDWLVRAPALALIKASLKKLRRAFVKGVAQEADACAAIDGLGINHEFRVAWLKSLPGLARIRGCIVRRGRSLADRAEILLRLAGEPLTKDEIAAALEGAFSVRTLANYLQRDRRFLRRGLNHYGLREWGGEEYTKIIDEIAQELERQGGEATLDHLIRTLTLTFGVSEASVRAYAQGPQFMRTNRGTFVVRTEPKSAAGGRAIDLTRNCYRLPNGWALRLLVSRELLRGSGAQIPAGFAAHIGLAPGTNLELPSPYGTVRLGWPSLQPHVGSVRAALEALGASEGDFCFLTMLASRRVEFSIARKAASASLSSWAQLAWAMGIANDVPSTELCSRVAHAIGLDGHASLADIRRRLALRDEHESLALLPQYIESDNTHSAPSVDRLAAVLARIMSRRSDT